MEIRKVAVIGYPVKHSLSPKLHGYWLDFYKDELAVKGVKGEYGMLEVKPEDLEKTLLGLKDNGYVGCNITVPHKERAFEIVSKFGSIDNTAKLIGAVNTIAVINGKLFGTNTDAYGFIENIKSYYSNFKFSSGRSVVLGAGGAARAVIYGLANSGVERVIITNRTASKAEELKILADDISKLKLAKNIKIEAKVIDWEKKENILDNANILVNTTSLGMTGQPDLDINLDKLPKDALVTDIVYKPLETTLLKNARNHGNKVVDGLGMLLYQAQGGFELWFGIKPEVTEELRKHILSGI